MSVALPALRTLTTGDEPQTLCPRRSSACTCVFAMVVWTTTFKMWCNPAVLAHESCEGAELISTSEGVVNFQLCVVARKLTPPEVNAFVLERITTPPPPFGIGKSPRALQLWLGNAATEAGEEYVSVVVQISPAIESGNRPCDAMEIKCESWVMLNRRFRALGSAAIVENAVDHVTGAIDASVDTLALPANTYCVPASNGVTGTKIQVPAPAGTASIWMAPLGPDSVACTVSNDGFPA